MRSSRSTWADQVREVPAANPRLLAAAALSLLLHLMVIYVPIAGATLYLLLLAAGMPRPFPTLLGMTAVVVLRFASILWSLHLPTFGLPNTEEENERR